MLNERRRRIEEGQHNAEKIKKQLAEAELRYQEVLRKANEQATRLLEEARTSSDAISQKQLQQAIKDAEGIIAKAQDTIVQERNKMIYEVKKEMVGLVVNTTAKVVGKVLTPEDQKRLSEETVKQLAA
jgi:F-type H+-transporting ATPase subunit b